MGHGPGPLSSSGCTVPERDGRQVSIVHLSEEHTCPDPQAVSPRRAKARGSDGVLGRDNELDWPALSCTPGVN